MKKTFWALLLSAATLCVLLTACGGGKTSASGGPSTLESNADRVKYLRELGWEVEEEPIEKDDFQLPETLQEPYLSYNAIQLPQGFDLGQYCGESVTRYTYAVLNHPKRETGVQANLYLCGGIPIAGDIFCPGLNGFQERLIQTSSDADVKTVTNDADDFETGYGGDGNASASGGPSTLGSNADRVKYLRELGWEVEEEPIEKDDFQLPETLQEPYLSYNAFQLPQGFDLGQYCGESVTRYTYAVLNHPKRETGVQANLYLCGGIPIAGDIFCPGLNGFQEPLIQTSSNGDFKADYDDDFDDYDDYDDYDDEWDDDFDAD